MTHEEFKKNTLIRMNYPRGVAKDCCIVLAVLEVGLRSHPSIRFRIAIVDEMIICMLSDALVKSPNGVSIHLIHRGVMDSF